MSVHPLDELKDYIGFTDEDSARLQTLSALVDDDELGRIGNDFYDRTLLNPRTAAVLSGPEQVAKLKLTMKTWLKRLLDGPHDHDYYEERLIIGRRHVEVNLPNEFMFTGINIIRQEVTAFVYRLLGADAADTLTSVNRILDVELAIMLGTYMNERQRVQLEDFRELIVSHLPVSIFLIDEGGRVAAFTHQDTRLWRQAAVLGQKVDAVLHPSFSEQTGLLDVIADATDKRREVLLPRVDVVFDDESRSYRITIIPLEHDLATTLVHVEDLTDTIASEVRAQRAESLAKIGTLAAQVAHEVRNPLAGISGTMQIISKSFDDDDRRRTVLIKVQEQITRLDSLVTDLLSFSRPVQAKLQEIDLVDAIRPAIEGVRASGMGDTQVTGEGRAMADPHLLNQALLNIVQNAWQAGAQQVRVHVQDAALTVSDDGPGIAPDKREDIFEPFVTSRTRGTGLGLPVARRTIEVMHGDLSVVDGTDLPGACFAFRLCPVE